MKTSRSLQLVAIALAGAAACLSIDERTIVDSPDSSAGQNSDGGKSGSAAGGSGTSAGSSIGGDPSRAGESSGGTENVGGEPSGGSAGTGASSGSGGDGGEPPIADPNCGNGVIDADEACDDNNGVNGDGCTDCERDAGFTCMGEPTVCTPVCHDGLVRGNEKCDDGPNNLEAGCDASCQITAGWGCWGEPSVCAKSCAGMTETACSGESCCERDAVSGGTLKMGRGTETCTGCVTGCPPSTPVTSCDDPEGYKDTPEHNAGVNQFILDRFEVTVGRFRRFVDNYAIPIAGAGAHPAIAGTGWQSAWPIAANSAALKTSLNCPGTDWTTNPGANEQLPINCVNWYHAFAFCIWDGGRLPTEAEWEFAAAGGDQNRVYPWGATALSTDLALYGCPGGCSGGVTSNLVGVGSKPNGVGRYGSLDLAGSVQEWVFDYYSTYTTSFCNNCAATTVPNFGDYRARRGGNWRSTVGEQLRAADRVVWEIEVATFRNDVTGFRCARSP